MQQWQLNRWDDWQSSRGSSNLNTKKHILLTQVYLIRAKAFCHTIPPYTIWVLMPYQRDIAVAHYRYLICICSDVCTAINNVEALKTGYTNEPSLFRMSLAFHLTFIHSGCKVDDLNVKMWLEFRIKLLASHVKDAGGVRANCCVPLWKTAHEAMEEDVECKL